MNESTINKTYAVAIEYAAPGVLYGIFHVFVPCPSGMTPSDGDVALPFKLDGLDFDPSEASDFEVVDVFVGGQSVFPAHAPTTDPPRTDPSTLPGVVATVFAGAPEFKCRRAEVGEAISLYVRCIGIEPRSLHGKLVGRQFLPEGAVAEPTTTETPEADPR